MKPPPPWTDRRFAMDTPPELAPVLVERLRGAPWRAAGMLRHTSAERLRERRGEKWSILDHVGHLGDLDRSLFLVRLRVFQAGDAELPPADLQNPDTWEAGHHQRDLREVLERFRRSRQTVVARLDDLDPELFARPARHPRLGVDMRLIDMLLFHAEHDDHHLAWVRALLGA